MCKRSLSKYSNGACGCKTTNADRPPAAGRKTKRSHKHLEGDNKRPVGGRHREGLSGRLPVETPTESTTSHSTILCETESINCGGGKGTSRQRSHKRSPQPSGRVLLKPVPCPKKGRRATPGDKPEGSEQFYTNRALQDGGHPYPQRPSSQSGGLVGKGGSEGRIFCSPDPRITPPIPEVLLPREMLSVPVPPIRPVIGSLGLYQDPKASTSPPPGDGDTVDSIYRRHPCLGGVQGIGKESCGGPCVPPAMSGVSSEPEEVSSRTSPSDGIPGPHSGHSPDGAEAPSGQDKKDPCGVTSYGQRRPGVRQSPGQAGGKDECNITGDPTSPIILSPSADGPVEDTEHPLPVLRGTSSPDTGMQGGTDVVGHPHDQLEWEVPPQEGSGHNHRLTDRVGCHMSGAEDRRSLVSERRQDAHKLSGVAGCNASGEDIPEEQIQDVSTPQVGQYHGSGIHKQPGRDSLQGIGRPSKEPMDVVFGKEHPHHSSTPARCSECDSRCGVSDHERPLGLATESSHIQENCQPVRSNRSGYVYLTTDGSVPSLFQLAARSLCSGNRCLPAGLVSHQGVVCQPTLEPGRSSSVQSTERSDPHCSVGPSLEDTAMVSSATADVNCNTMSDHSCLGNAIQRSGGSRPSTSRVAHLRERYRDQELSEEAASLMLKSWRTKTTTHSLANGIAGVVQGTQIPFQDL